MVLAGTAATAQAQLPPAEAMPPPPPAPTASGDPDAGYAVPPPPVMVAPAMDPSAPPQLMLPTVPPPNPLMVHRFRTGRALYGVGTAIGLVGSGLTLASIFVTSVYGLEQTPGDGLTLLGPSLAYAGSGATGVGFILAISGVGLEHSALRLVGQDPGRSLYATGTLFGLLGLCGIGTSYYFGLANPVNNSTAIAFGTSIAATALLTVGGLLFFADATRLGTVYRRLTTF